jgi:DNA helicase II / ATP-dependent DNA helicase PcrA
MSEYLESPEQTRLIRYQEGEGALLVVASAGSGKTHILTERVRYLLTEKIGRFSVLCLTFTNKAAEEMKDRLNDVPDIKRRAMIG